MKENNKEMTVASRKPRIKTQFNYELKLKKVNYKPSLTVPDQSKSIRTILEMHTRGQTIDAIMKQPIYDGTEDVMGINPKMLDFTDIEILARRNSKELTRLQKEKAHLDKVKAEKEAEIAQKEVRRQKQLDMLDEIEQRAREKSTNTPT